MEPRLYRVAQAILWRDADCADAVQEAVFRAWMKKGGLRTSEYFETWLTRILINACRDTLRRRKHEASMPDNEPGAEDGMCESLALRMALKRVPEKYRLPLVLHHAAGYTVADVARMLGTTRSAVASRMVRARKMMRELLEEE